MGHFCSIEGTPDGNSNLDSDRRVTDFRVPEIPHHITTFGPLRTRLGDAKGCKVL